MKLTCISNKANLTVPRHIRGLLFELGYLCRRDLDQHFKRGSFWLVNAGRLDWIMFDARKLYRKKMKQLHPDCGGNLIACARLNMVWQRIVKLVKQRTIR